MLDGRLLVSLSPHQTAPGLTVNSYRDMFLGGCRVLAGASSQCSRHLLIVRREFAGHSKWAKIKRAKGANDKQRAALFAKIAAEITAASRAAGGDLANIRLAAAVSRAKANNVPKDNVEAAIKRGVESKEASNVEVVQYEGMGPGSCALIIECLTDNRKRTAPSIRHILSKHGGSLGTSGSVSWNFDRRGVLVSMVGGAANKSLDDLLEVALEAGAEDVEDGEEESEGQQSAKEARILCDPAELGNVRKELEEKGWPISSLQFEYIPKSSVELGDEEGELLGKILDALEEDADVQYVFHNGRLSEANEAAVQS